MLSAYDTNEIDRRWKRGNSLLLAPDDEVLSPLISILKQGGKRSVILWSFACAQESMERLEELCPEETRPREALALSVQWSRGEIKMPMAKGAILACHQVAREVAGKEEIALVHAVAQACSSVHAKDHALAYPCYDLTSRLHRYGIREIDTLVEDRVSVLLERFLYWEERADSPNREWAGFILKADPFP